MNNNLSRTEWNQLFFPLRFIGLKQFSCWISWQGSLGKDL